MTIQSMTTDELTNEIELGSTTFSEAQFEQMTLPASLDDLTFEHCRFIECNFSSSSMTNTRFEHCQFYHEASEVGSAFRYCNLSHAIFSDCDLRHCDFSQANWYDLALSNCRGLEMISRGVSNQKWVNERVCLQALHIQRSDLTLSDFSYAQLGESTLHDCRCSEVDWTEANLAGSQIIQCDLTGGQFDRVAIGNADLSESLFNSIDPRQIDVEGVRVTSDQLPLLVSALGLVITDL